MQLLLIISAIILVGFIVTFFDRRRQMKVLREKLTRNYGQKPDKKKTDLEKIKIYWASVSKNAIKLLEYVGFPQEIITNAREMI